MFMVDTGFSRAVHNLLLNWNIWQMLFLGPILRSWATHPSLWRIKVWTRIVTRYSCSARKVWIHDDLFEQCNTQGKTWTDTHYRLCYSNWCLHPPKPEDKSFINTCLGCRKEGGRPTYLNISLIPLVLFNLFLHHQHRSINHVLPRNQFCGSAHMYSTVATMHVKDGL